MSDRRADPSPRLSVLFGADSLIGQRTGVGRYTLEVARAARAEPGLERVELLVEGELQPIGRIDRLDDGFQDATPPVPPIPWKVAVGRVPGVQMLRRHRKRAAFKRDVRALSRASGRRMVYHETNMITRAVDLPTVSTIHDLSWLHHPSWHPAARLRWIDLNLKATLRQTCRFVAVSKFTRQAAVTDLGIPPDRVTVAPNAPAAEFRPMRPDEAAAVLSGYRLMDRRYVLSTSTLEPRKNFDRLLAAYLRLPPAVRDRVPLVIAGGKGWGEVLSRPEADAAIRDGAVRLLGHVSDGDLAMLTARAGVFAYVSLYEGFGLPVIEAMAAGSPVLASNTTAVGELAAGAALLVDPLDEAAIAEGLRRLIEDGELAESLRQAGLARAAEYTWQRTIDALVLSWRKALQ